MPAVSPERATKSLRTLHAGMLVILAGFGLGGWIYIGALEAPKPGEPTPSWDSVQLIFFMLAAISVAMLAMIPVIRARVMPVIPPGLKLRGGSEAMERAIGTVLGKWGNANLVSWALAMSVGLYGVVLAAMLQDIWPYPVFAVPAAAVLLHYRPSLQQARGLVARLSVADSE